MDKQIIYGISNREDFICYIIGKNKGYYDFLFALLKEFNANIPDLYEINGKLPDITKEVDSISYEDNKNISIIEFVGYKKIFLLIKTNQREKLTQFMEKNCIFFKPKK